MSKLGFWNGLKVTGHLYWCAERLHRHSTRFPLCLNDLWRGGSHSEAVPELGSPRRGAGSGWYWVAEPWGRPCVPKGRGWWAWAPGSRQPGRTALRPSLVEHGAGAVRDPGACHVTWVKRCENTALSGENHPFSLQSAFPGL